MTCETLLQALGLPESARVAQRVPKKLLIENGAPTAADKRQINEGIEELVWLAALKPTTIGVPEYRETAREYLEIAVLRMTLRGKAKVARLVELVHRAIPYPVLLLTENASRPGVSVAHKRWSQGEQGKTVLDGDVVSVEQREAKDDPLWDAFCSAIALDKQPRATIHALYQGWINTLQALHAARVTGTFALPASPEHAAARGEALQECARLEADIARLRTAAKKQKQISKKVDTNLAIRQAQARLNKAKDRL